MWMDYETFADLVGDALSTLPDDIQSWLDNVEVVVEDWPSSAQLASVGVRGAMSLLGLYEGVPRTARSSQYGMVLPDKVTVFRGPLLAAYPSAGALRIGVRRTVVHELAHHFGIDDDRLRELGAY